MNARVLIGRLLGIGILAGTALVTAEALYVSYRRPLTDDASVRANLIGIAPHVSGPLTEGWPSRGPYDVIILNGASQIVPKALLRQLKPSGRLVGVLRQGAAGKAMLYRPIGGEYSGRPVFDAAAPLLPGFAEPVAFVF